MAVIVLSEITIWRHIDMDWSIETATGPELDRIGLLYNMKRIHSIGIFGYEVESDESFRHRIVVEERSLSQRPLVNTKKEKEMSEVSWNGTGLPPKGCVCECIDDDGVWYKGEIVYIGKSHGRIIAILQAENNILYGTKRDFRKVLTEEEKQRESDKGALKAMLLHDDLSCTLDEVIESILDAGFTRAGETTCDKK